MHLRKLPRDILERIERVNEYHRSTKLSAALLRAQPMVLDAATKPSPYRCFDSEHVVQLPTALLDASAPTLDVLAQGVGAVSAEDEPPAQDLQTLASWLYLADGLIARHDASTATATVRTCPSAGSLYPYEIYVAAFGVEGLEPGLYHYNVRDYCLCRLRDGPTTLATIKRGRPDLNFLRSVPATILVSTNYWRSAWRYRVRGYRMALLDAGHLVQNLVAAANGLGIATMPRLATNDKNMRELIGVHTGSDFDEMENVQAMVVWAAETAHPLMESAGSPGKRSLPRIERDPLSKSFIPFGAITATHDDCVAPGMAIREIKPPLTELSPVALGNGSTAPPYEREPVGGPSIREVVIGRRSTREFADRPLTRDQFLAINRLSFRGGSVFPLSPDGPHVALLRPYWIVSRVNEMPSGVWHYHPAADALTCVATGDFGEKAAFLCCEQKVCGEAAALCFMAADLKTLTAGAGPDVYRLAHLEAGLMGQRIYLAANAMDVGCCGVGAFYDDAAREFLGLAETGWELIYAMAVGAVEDGRE